MLVAATCNGGGMYAGSCCFMSNTVYVGQLLNAFSECYEVHLKSDADVMYPLLLLLYSFHLHHSDLQREITVL